MSKKLITPALTLALLAGLGVSQAHANEGAIDWGLTYKADIAGVLDGGSSQSGRFLDNLELTADISLERVFGWQGAHVYAHLLNNSGGAPNDIAGTLQGVDNIEVERPRGKLYQFWIEQEFAGGRGSVLAGLYDLNSEFYVTDAAGVFIAPAFGIGSELAATGPNGPSIFPSTALSLRGRWALTENQAIQAAIVNAHAGVLGDPGGVDDEFDNGALIIAEWARGGAINVRVGAWRYSDDQHDIRDTDGLGDPLQRTANGAYVSAEGVVWDAGDDDVRETTAFVRVGGSDGDTTDFSGGWQAGLTVTQVFEGRPDSVFGIGFNQAFVTSKFRANEIDLGNDPAHAESAVELTYSDRLLPYLTLQPDIQIIHEPGADRARDNVVVGTLRVTVEF
jgi:porin